MMIHAILEKTPPPPQRVTTTKQEKETSDDNDDIEEIPTTAKADDETEIECKVDTGDEHIIDGFSLLAFEYELDLEREFLRRRADNQLQMALNDQRLQQQQQQQQPLELDTTERCQVSQKALQKRANADQIDQRSNESRQSDNIFSSSSSSSDSGGGGGGSCTRRVRRVKRRQHRNVHFNHHHHWSVFKIEKVGCL